MDLVKAMLSLYVYLFSSLKTRFYLNDNTGFYENEWNEGVKAFSL